MKKYNRIIAGIMALMLVFGAGTAVVHTKFSMPDSVVATSAETLQYGSLSYKILDNDTITITGFDDSVTEVEIPSEIEGLPVTSIGDYTFRGRSGITSVTIPDSVTSIGDRAFYGCSGLTSITIPNSVTSIGNGAFESCTALTSFTIPTSVTSIGDYTFSGCSGLTSVTIPDSVTSIGGAFIGCGGLTSVTIPDSVTSINGTFYNCTSLTSINVSENNKYYSDTDGVLFNKDKTELVRYPIGKDSTEYIIPDSVIKIGAVAFYGCSNLTEIIIPDGVTSIGSSAFGSCENLASVEIPDSVTTVGVNTFAFCNSLKSIELSSNLEKISHEMFYCCSSLESIYIPDSVTEIGYRAFTSCINLKEIHIPSSVEKIYYDCFSYCESLKEISLPDSITEWHIFADSEYYGEGGIGTTFGNFFGCSSLESVKISTGLKEIGYQDFGNCFSLKSIVIPENIESIGNYAFCNSPSIEKITFLNPDCNIPLEAAITSECIICGYDNSTAQAYAEKSDHQFVSLGEAPETPTPETPATADDKGDINGDGLIDAVDASLILSYYAYLSTDGTMSLDEFLDETLEK